MEIVHINYSQPIKSSPNKIVNLFSRETVKLKAIYHHLKGNLQIRGTQFTGFTA